DKGMLLSSFIRYYLARLQSMFKYEGLPDTIPQKWLENYLLVNGSCVWIETDKGLIVTRAGIGGKPDEYYIPTECIVTNPYIQQTYNRIYTRDKDCVLMVNDTYAQGLLPMLKMFGHAYVEALVSQNLNCIMSRGSVMISAADDKTKDSAELWVKRLTEGQMAIIGESPMLIGNQDSPLTVNQLSGADTTITNLIEYMQYIKASLYNALGLQSNYNMKREAIMSGESQLDEDMLHPLIDNMLKERQDALEKVNAMFGTDISVSFNSAWELNEREQEAAIETIESEADNAGMEDNNDSDISDNGPVDDAGMPESEQIEETEETVEQTPEEAPEVEITITEQAVEEIAEAVAEKLDEDKEDETDKEQSDDSE
ncbi:MAG: hypothetical protein IKY46_07080, partial [Clostridia bacterium]|nr:hypothetical protein [Clostridia bacterium]